MHAPDFALTFSHTKARPSAPAAPTPNPGPVLPPSSSKVRSTVAVTVRLDHDRYQALKQLGAKRRLTNQDILVAALDHVLAQEN